MSRGSGTVVRTNAVQPGGGGVLTLDNGLTLTGTNGQWGGALLANTLIPLAGFDFSMFDGAFQFNVNTSVPSFNLNTGGGSELILDGSTGITSLGDVTPVGNATVLTINDTAQNVQVTGGGFTFFDLDIAGLVFAMGDLGNTGNGTQLQMLDNNRAAVIATALGSMLRVDQTSGLYQMGDIASVNNGIEIRLDDVLQQIFITTSNSGPAPSYLFLDETNSNAQLVAGDTSFFVDDLISTITAIINANDVLVMDQTNNLYQLGDISNSNNGLFLNINDGFQVIQLGALGGGGNQTAMVISDASQFVSMQSAGEEMFRMDKANDLYEFGDIDAGNNGAVISLQDAGGVLVIGNTANNLAINMNGVAGFTGTVTPVVSITVNNGIVTAVA